MSAQVEQWRVSTSEGVFETDLATLKQWIVEGCVLPTDKVSKGSLSWIEAGKAPMLKTAFTGNAEGSISATVVVQPSQPEVIESAIVPQQPPVPSSNASAATGSNCQNHPNEAAHYICSRCEVLLCSACPRLVSNIPLCSECGELCKLRTAVQAKQAQTQFQTSGFGMDDFARAIRYPLQHKAALAFGAIIYGLLLLAGFRGAIIAYVLMFGCMSHVISQVAWGRLNRSFMPDFSAFSPWDDLVVPIFLGIGITIVTWGPIIVLVIALVFGVLSGGPSSSPMALTPPQAEQTGPTSEDLSVLTDPNADPEELAAANKKLNATRPGAQIAAEAERSRHESDPGAGLKMLLPYLGAGILLLMLFVLGLLWAIFYYPMALAVAGYTQSLGSVINPLVGLDTIKRMGSTYFKAFGMVLVIQIVGGVVGGIVAFVTSPLALPFVGNLPAKFIDGSVTFYINLVISCLLGLSLFKCADRLGIAAD